MLATLAAKPPEGPGWAWELKWDGIRALGLVQDGQLRLWTRNANEVTSRYPELQPLGGALDGHDAFLDGEIVTFDDQGRPSFGRLQRRMHVQAEHEIARLAVEVPVVYVVFDLLWLDGHLTTALPYEDRRRLLMTLVPEGATWRVPAHELGDGHATIEVSHQFSLEGVVAKRLDSTYEPGRRTGAWVKVKHLMRQELVVGGWIPGQGAARADVRRAAARLLRRLGRAAVCGARGHRLHRGDPRRPPISTRVDSRGTRHRSPTRSRAGRPSTRRTSSNRSSSPRSASPSGPSTGASAIPRSSASATTSPPARSPASPEPTTTLVPLVQSG